jgi:hypothetical protein
MLLDSAHSLIPANVTVDAATSKAVTASSSDPTMPFSIGLLFSALRGEAELDLTTVPDNGGPLLRQMLLDMKEDATRNITAILNGLDAEFEARMKARGGAIPTPLGAIEAAPVYTEYAYDVPGLQKAQALLPKKDAEKILKHVPVEIIPAHDVPGNPRSITSIRDKYPGSVASELLAKAMTRQQVGVRVKWPKIEGAIEGSAEHGAASAPAALAAAAAAPSEGAAPPAADAGSATRAA